MSGVEVKPLSEVEHHWYTDASGNKHGDGIAFQSAEDSPSKISFGAWIQPKSDRVLRYDSEVDEAKYVVEGEITLIDVNTGDKHECKAGDLIFIRAGTSVDYFTRSSFVGLVVDGSAGDIEDLVTWHGERALKVGE